VLLLQYANPLWVVTEIETVERRLQALLESSALPEKANYGAIDRFLVDTYRGHWPARSGYEPGY
jgi:hypothetical protein